LDIELIFTKALFQLAKFSAITPAAVTVTVITPDIFILKKTRAFWHQITFTFNKPAPLGAKIL
jgi:hypothetical protein